MAARRQLGAKQANWASAKIGGHVNRLKTIQCQMYGRAGFGLLKARVVNVV